MTIKNIIWDWNGTIVDDTYLFVKIMNNILRDKKLPKITIKDYRQKFCFPIKKYWKHLGFQFNNQLFNQMNSQFINKYKQKIFEPKLHENIKCIFKTIAGQNKSQFIVSASEHSLLIDSVKHYKIEKYFKDIKGVNNLNAIGKEKLALELILKYNLNPQKTILVGDTEHDYKVAQSIGAHTILVGFGHIHKERLLKTEQTVIDSVQELELFFKYLN